MCQTLYMRASKAPHLLHSQHSCRVPTHAAGYLLIVTKRSRATTFGNGFTAHSMKLSLAGRAAHVRVGDVVEEVVQEAVGAVHGAERAAQPVPLARRKVRQRRVPECGR